ncbi:AraC family transcriptional regulator [Streptomyces griseus]|uniref:AraC family transcriptional regulator n=1 Tax=Streptomyces griseus TaxID=1911 RepID=UPI00374E1210
MMPNIRHAAAGQGATGQGATGQAAARPAAVHPAASHPAASRPAAAHPAAVGGATAVRHAPVAPTRTRRLAPGGSIDAHRHDDHQIVYAGRGVLTVTTDAGSWVAPGTRAIWVPAGVVHAHRAYGELDLHLVGLPVTENPLGLDAPTVLAVSPLLRELLIAYTRAEDDGESPERARLRAVLLDQLRASDAQQPLHLPTPTAPPLRDLCAILRADPGDGRTLAELGRQVGAGDRTLSRLFRSDLGMTFPQWRTQLRLHHALILLTERTPVTAVAHQCGWSSASAFIEVFRRTFGHTPGSHPAG